MAMADVQSAESTPFIVMVGIRKSSPSPWRAGATLALSGILLLAICAMNGMFDRSEQIDLVGKMIPTVRAVPITLPLKDIARSVSLARANHQIPATKLAAQRKTSLVVSGAPSLAGMEREVLELEKQIQRHMTVRQNSLQNALQATSKCASGDDACLDANKQINWKLSQDRYEQAAMNDILKQDNATNGTKQSTSTEGASLFQHYASKAEQLSGLKSMSSLNARTEHLAKLHSMAEHKSLAELRDAEKKLNSLRMAERKDLEDKREVENEAAISQTAKHVKSELAKMNGDNDDMRSTSEKAASSDQTERKYLSDFEQAKQIELERRQAFLDAEKQLHAKVLAEREDREKTLTAEEQQSGPKSMVSEGGSSKAVPNSYSETVQEALKVDSERHQALEAARQKSAAADLARSVALEHEKSGSDLPDTKFMRQAEDASSDATYRDDVQEALHDSSVREHKEGSLIARARESEAEEDSKAQAKANEEVERTVAEAASVSTGDSIPKDYSDVSSQTYVHAEAAARGHALAETASERAERQRFLRERSERLGKDAADEQSVIASRESEVAKIVTP